MKFYVLPFLMSMIALGSMPYAYSQESTVEHLIPSESTQGAHTKELQIKVDKADRKAKKSEKAGKKLERKAKKHDRSVRKITSLKKSIERDERKTLKWKKN